MYVIGASRSLTSYALLILLLSNCTFQKARVKTAGILDANVELQLVAYAHKALN